MNNISISDDFLFENNLQQDDIWLILDMVSKKIFDYSDLFFQSNYHESWVMEDNIIKNGYYNVTKGVGIRVVKGETTGFSYTDDLTLNSLIKSASMACSIINNNDKTEISNYNKGYHSKLSSVKYQPLYDSSNPLSDLSKEDKIELLFTVNKIARSIDRRVQKVTVNLSGMYEKVLIISTDGTFATDIRPLVRLFINVQVEQDGRREQGSSGGGGRCGYDFFLESYMDENRMIFWSKEAVRIALINLSAIEAPAGVMTVVLGSGWPGILLHEAIGHGLEGDFNRKCSSIFSNRMGEKVASELCTIVDDGTLTKLRGSLSIDDEGVPSRYNILIENGVLKSYLQDKLNARLMNVPFTGNGRRESYAHLPMPRMTNTYMLAGYNSPQEIISSVDYGIYAPNFGSGQVDITSGKFVFSTSEAYLIKKGIVVNPIKGATLIGSGIEVMQQISMVGNDLLLDSGVGTCIKNGQSVPVGVGQPTLKLDKITVGGTYLMK